MSPLAPRRRTLDGLKKEARQWLTAIRAGAPDARTRFIQDLPDGPPVPTLRDVQLALARLHGFDGWANLKRALTPDPATSARTLAHYRDMAEALLEAYRTGTPAAMERHYRFTWHRRPWAVMRDYAALDLGKPLPAHGEGVDFTLDDARRLVAIEHGVADWAALEALVVSMPAGVVTTARPVRIVRADPTDDERPVLITRDWPVALRALAQATAPGLDAAGQMTDAMLADVRRVEHLARLDLGGSKAVSDEGVGALAGHAALRHLNLGGTAITDRALEVLRTLPALESLSLWGTRVTDAGMDALRRCDALRSVDLGGTAVGDAAIRALAGKPQLRTFHSGQGLTDEGLAALHDWPVFKGWQGGQETMALLSYDAGPNYLNLRGRLSDRGLQQLQGLDGLFALNVDARDLAFTAAGIASLVSLPRLGWLAADAKDDWMPHIAAMPRLRFLGAQDTTAGDAGFVALGRSPSIEYIWGRRCHNLGTRGFLALSEMPALRGLSVSCLNVDDEGLAALPRFPALRELMPMDVPDAGYRHIGRCRALESLVLMYCRDTTDAATEHLVGLPSLRSYFNSYTTITDRTPELLSQVQSLERITFDNCHRLTNVGVAHLARLPRLSHLRVNSQGVTPAVRRMFAVTVDVDIEGAG
jgi:hypothetical protein